MHNALRQLRLEEHDSIEHSSDARQVNAKQEGMLLLKTKGNKSFDLSDLKVNGCQ